jgi:hypothetical protein
LKLAVGAGKAGAAVRLFSKSKESNPMNIILGDVLRRPSGRI